MKVKDLEKDVSLGGVRIKTPKGVVGIWKSQWHKGVWFTDGQSSRIYPQFVDQLSDAAEWEITEEPINCHKRTDLYSIDNTKDNSTEKAFKTN